MRPPIVLPWSHLAQANHRLLPVIRWNGKMPRAQLITAPAYRQAKETAEIAIRKQWKGSQLSGPLQLVAKCYFPDKRKRDSSNYAKLIEDACAGIVYEDDSQIEDSRWIKAGYDKENPRIEISISPISEAAA